MKKILYWMRKVGMLRTSSYVAKNAKELNEVHATEGGMLQSQKEIDEKYKPADKKKDAEQSSSGNGQGQMNKKGDNKKGDNNKGGGVIFWVFLVIGVVLLSMMLLMGFSFWFVLLSGVWIWFLYSIKTGNAKVGLWAVGQPVLVGIILIVISVIFVSFTAPSGSDNKSDDKMSTGNAEVQNEKQGTVKKDVATENDVAENTSNDKIVKFFKQLASGVGLKISQPVSIDKAVWKNGGAGLSLQTPKKIDIKNVSEKDWVRIKQYFENQGGTHGTIGMTYPSNQNETGYYFTQKGDFYMLMCILVRTNSTATIACGWGPGGGEKS